MSLRSVIETLDLQDDNEKYHSEGCASQSCGCLSPRISFSTDFISGSSDKPSVEKQKNDEGHSYSPDFEFSMSSFGILDTIPSVPADELFHKGKLLPGYVPPHPTAKDVVSTEDNPLENARPGSSSRHLNSEMTSARALSPLGGVIGSSCVRPSKGAKWRELFGALRRVKSDSGRQRIPDESLLPPKAMHGRRTFFKHFFSSGQSGTHDPKFSTNAYCGTRPCPSASSDFATLVAQDRSSPTDSLSAKASTSGLPSVYTESDDKEPADGSLEVFNSEPGRASNYRGKTSEQLSDEFTFNPLPGRPSSTSTSPRPSTSSTGRSSPIKVPANRGSNLMRSGSGRVIVRGLDRVSSGRNSSPSLQEQIRALRAREIRRSPERSGYSNVRVTPVLNVPVCMGPVLRGATKAGKGRLSNFRSFLTFRSKLSTPLVAPIATR